ncbi:MAG: hypothetical protein ACJAUG_000732 [Halioglobus sp.]|jgi:hypothetical protein
MGIATYVSREQVPGSAVTRKLAIVKPERAQLASLPISDTGHSPITGKAGGVAQMPSLDLPTPSPSISVAARLIPAAATVTSRTVEFGIAAFMTDGWLWLEELPSGQALMRDQVQLVQAMATAMGWGSRKPEIAQFNWPIYTNNQLDIGEEAARGALGGFINRKLEQSGCRSIVLLGNTCARWVPVDQLSTDHQISTVSTTDMLREPSLKKKAWQDLLPHAK